MSDKQEARAAEPEVVSPVESLPPAAAPAVVHRLTPEEVGPGPAFDPSAPLVRTPAVAKPEAKKSEQRVTVLYTGPNDEFHAEFDGQLYRTSRFDAVEMPKSALEWLQQQYPAHSWAPV